MAFVVDLIDVDSFFDQDFSQFKAFALDSVVERIVVKVITFKALDTPPLESIVDALQMRKLPSI